MRTSPNSHEKMLECLPHSCRVVQEVYEHLMMCLKCSWLHLTLYNIFCFKKCKLSAPNAISFNPRLIYIQKCGLTAQIKMRLTLCQPLCHPPLFLPNGQPPCQPPSVSHACQPHFIKCIKMRIGSSDQNEADPMSASLSPSTVFHPWSAFLLATLCQP